MTTHIDFYDDTTNMMKHLADTNLGLVKEGLSKASRELAKQFRNEFEKIEDTTWQRRHTKDGEVFLTHGEKKKNFGDMHFRDTDEPMPSKYGTLNIKNLIKFYTPPQLTSLYAVVAGGHRSFSPIKWRDGLKVGKLNYISGTGKNTLDILDKLEYGEVRMLTANEQKMFRASFMAKRGINNPKPKMVEYKARKFGQKARASVNVIAAIQQLYEKSLPKAVNKLNRDYHTEVTKFGNKVV